MQEPFSSQEEKFKEIVQLPSLEVLDCLPKEICFISPQMEILWMNKAFRLRFPEIDIEKKPLCYKSVFSPPKENICLFCPVIKAFQTGEEEFAESEPCKEGRISRITATPIKDREGRIICVMETVEDITKIKYSEKRLEKLQTVFLKLGSDFDKNIELLVSACGELLGADVSLYNRLEGELLCSIGKWNVPKDFKSLDKAQGHICYDVIKKTSSIEPLIVKDLPNTLYYQTDPNVKLYGLKTYIGYPVSYAGKIRGSLCAVYKKDFDFSQEDIRIMEIIATAIGIEEERYRVNLSLQRKTQFEELITGIASSFINLPLENIDSAINEALKKIGEFCDVDRAYVFLTEDRGRKVSNTHEWCKQGIKSLIDGLQHIPVEDFLWFAQKIRNKEIVYIKDIAELPPEAEPLRRLLSSQEVISMICVPIIYEAEVIGFLGFDLVNRKKEFSDTEINLLKLTSEVLGSCLMRKRIHQQIFKTNIKLKRLALKDPLTGLYNHRYLEEIIEREFHRSRRYGYPFSLLMIDLDYFKYINETYGYHFGDLILKQLAKQIKTLVRKYDIVIRYSGEEFLVIAPGIDKSAGLSLGRRILDEVGRIKFGDKKNKINIKLSIAVISYPEDQVPRSMDLIILAERIISKAKEHGGNEVFSTLDFQTKVTALPKFKTKEEVKILKQNIEKLTQKANQNLMESIYALAKTIEAKDHYTGEHVEKTVHYAVEIARRLNLSSEEIEHIRQAAILHDLGKIGISEKILLKRTKLTEEEFLQIKNHPRIAVEILRPVHFLYPIIPLVLSHHERWDGRGYPHGLKKEEIPIGARILAVADVFQALISDRPYRKAYSLEEAIEIIKKGRASQFDPKVVDAFLEVLKKE